MSQRDGQFRCPECQTQIAIPEGNRFDQLPTSFLHNSLLSLLAVQQSAMEIILLADFARRRRMKQAIVSNAKKCYVATV